MYRQLAETKNGYRQLTSFPQILIATSTLAWGVNFPAHLVVVKGTEYYDGKTRRYVDFPITDVLQMMGRAGRPQYDDNGVAVILVHDIKKHFYKKFLYEPFPVESRLVMLRITKCIFLNIKREKKIRAFICFQREVSNIRNLPVLLVMNSRLSGIAQIVEQSTAQSHVYELKFRSSLAFL